MLRASDGGNMKLLPRVVRQWPLANRQKQSPTTHVDSATSFDGAHSADTSLVYSILILRAAAAAAAAAAPFTLQALHFRAHFTIQSPLSVHMFSSFF